MPRNGTSGMPGSRASATISTEASASAFGIARQLAEHRLVRGLRHPGLGDQHAGGDRHDQRRDLADQAVADRQHGVGRAGLSDRHAHLGGADDDAADHVDEGDQEARHRVAAHELGGAVHRAEEVRFVLQLLAPPSGRCILIVSIISSGAGSARSHTGLLAWHPCLNYRRRDLCDRTTACVNI